MNIPGCRVDVVKDEGLTYLVLYTPRGTVTSEYTGQTLREWLMDLLSQDTIALEALNKSLTSPTPLCYNEEV